MLAQLLQCYVGMLYVLNLIYYTHYVAASSRPSLKQLQKLVISSVATKWYELGLQLLDDNQENQLDIIRANSPTDVAKCCRDMFKYWLGVDPKASWYKLVDALKATDADMNNVIATLESNFTT